MIAHRLSTVLGTDHVVVFSDGRVVEQGTPSELSQQQSVFKGLLDAQRTTMDHARAFGKSEYHSETQSIRSSVAVSSGEKAGRDISDSPEEVPVTSLGLRAVLPQFWQIIRPDSFLILGGVMASTISGALLVGEALIFGAIISLLNQDASSPDFVSRASFLCLMFFVTALIALSSWICSGTAFGVASTRSVVRVQAKLLQHFLYLDLEWFAGKGHSVHDLMSAFTKDTGDLSCLSGPALGTIFTTTTSVVSGIILAHIVAWKIAVVLLSAVPVMLVAGFLRLKVLGSADTRRRSAYREATSLAAEACRARRTVAVFGLQGHILEIYHEALRVPYEKGRYFTIGSNILLAVSFAVTYFVYALAYWWGARQVRNGMYSDQDFFTVLPALLFSAQSAGQLFSLSPEIARAKAATMSIFKLLSSEPTILSHKDSKHPLSSPPGSSASSQANLPLSSPLPVQGPPTITLSNITLTYPSTASSTPRPALHSLSLTIPAGSTCALVGPSGAGKSSAISLLQRFHDPSTGSVSFDGTDIRTLDPTSLRRRVGLVAQEPSLLPGSVARNIRLGSTTHSGSESALKVSDQDIERVCRLVGLHDFICSLPEGYVAQVGTGGSGAAALSGGQQQRLALARALVRDPDVLLLDEFSSALDAHSERMVHEAVKVVNDASQGRRRRTTVIVAHRLASIKDVDKIFVLDQGKVVEQGTHDELVELRGLYFSMAKAQSLV